MPGGTARHRVFKHERTTSDPDRVCLEELGGRFRRITGRLTDYERALITEYMKDFNVCETALRCGFKGQRRVGGDRVLRTLRQPHVRDEINRRLKIRQTTAEISAQRVLEEYGAIAFANIDHARVWDDKGNCSIDISKLTERDMKAIASIKHGRYGIEIKFHNKVDALERLGQHVKLFGEQKETPVSVRFVIEGSPRANGGGESPRIAAEVRVGQQEKGTKELVYDERR